MRIGYVLNVFPKLSETFVLNEVVELLKRGHKVYIFSLGQPFENIRQKEVDNYNLLRRTYYFNSNYVTEGLKSLTNLKNLELIFSKERFLAKLACIPKANYFSQIIKDLEIDTLHSHFAGQTTFTNMCISKLTGIPFTFTGHAFDIFVNPNAKVLKEEMENSSAVITPSYYNKNYLHELTGVNKDKIHVIRACPNIERLKSIIKREKDAFTILTVARLVEKKGIKYGILAIKGLIKEFPELQYRIVGSGPLENELKEVVKSLNLENSVKFLGSLDGDSLMNELNRATIFILPSVRAKNGDMDGIPVSLMEAMYLQIPTISTTISGIPELIENRKEGFLAEQKNIEQLANAMNFFLEDCDLRIKMGENGRKKIEKEFNIHKEIEKLLKIWKGLK